MKAFEEYLEAPHPGGVSIPLKDDQWSDGWG